MKDPSFSPPDESRQLILFKPEVQDEIHGMGILENGIPYLTSVGLGAMCGVESKAIRVLGINWSEERFKKRGQRIDEILQESNYEDIEIIIPVEIRGQAVYAFPEKVCMAILEYYAHDASPIRQIALQNYRRIARKSFRDFIYTTLNYKPRNPNLTSWKHFHDRISVNKNHVPSGYFSIFHEAAGMIVDIIEAGLPISDKVLPDLSIGGSWGRYWTSKKLNNEYGERIKYPHYYPEYYPQAQSNPQEPWAYPNEALGEFRRWHEKVYLKEKYPRYIGNKIKDLLLPDDESSKRLLNLYKKSEIEENN